MSTMSSSPLYNLLKSTEENGYKWNFEKCKVEREPYRIKKIYISGQILNYNIDFQMSRSSGSQLYYVTFSDPVENKNLFCYKITNQLSLSKMFNEQLEIFNTYFKNKKIDDVTICKESKIFKFSIFKCKKEYIIFRQELLYDKYPIHYIYVNSCNTEQECNSEINIRILQERLL